MTSADWRGLADFLLAYMLVLATPGPNMLLVGGAAALHGVAGAFPLCLGAALGAGALSAALLLAASAVPDGGSLEWGGGLLGAALLLWVAVTVARQRPPPSGEARRIGGRGTATFAAGFCTAATNPLTAAFFGAQFLGTLAGGAGSALAPGAVIAVALAFMTGFAVLLARPACRRAALEWQRSIRLAASVALALMALSMAAGTLP